jgi:ribosomal protein S18 acetylase RimI-like enzyme
VRIRRATEADQSALRELWEEFEREVPFPYGEAETWDDEWKDTLDDIRAGGVFLAEDDEGAVGVARIEAPNQFKAAHVQLVHVRPRGRRAGVAKALLRECVADAKAKGGEFVSLEVMLANETALLVWRRLGFDPVSYEMWTPLDRLEERLGEHAVRPSHGSTHVQSDDETSVQRAIAGFLPRLESPQVTRGPSWIRIGDPVLDADRDAHAHFARELSERMGAVTVALRVEEQAVVRFLLFERGAMVDEYLSVPTHYGPLPKGDELALDANPTLVARLTGADRERVRAVARTAASPDELPPADELYAQIAELMGVAP